jgi:hypothetical protein
MTVPVIAEEDLQPYNDKVKRAAGQDEYLFSEVFHDVKINEITHGCSRVLSVTC